MTGPAPTDAPPSTRASRLPARLDLRPLLWAVPLAAGLGALLNTLIWWLLRSDFAGVQVGPAGAQMPFWSGAVPLFSLVGAVGGGLVYALITRLARRPNLVFGWVAGAVLLLSFLTPLTLNAAPISVVIGLELMHVVVWALVLRLVPRHPEH